MKHRVLVVDDDEATRNLLEEILVEEGLSVTLAKDGAELHEQFENAEPDVVLLDWKLPDANGFDLLPEVKRRWPGTQVIMLTSYATFDAAVDAVKQGAFHFQSKPFKNESLVLLIQRACEHRQLDQHTRNLTRALATLRGETPAVFKSKEMLGVLRLVERVAPSDAAILITGESGTGKEVIADLIHSLSHRASGPFVKVNCAALPRELIESELFGAAKGAYTGAHSDRQGLFQQAEGGTILLDEVSEMPLDTQAKLLRVLQEKSFRPVGGKDSYEVNCRIVASTNRKIEEAIKEGKLREDVYFRISAVTVHLPPLRERRDDILPLAHAFLKRFAAQAGANINGFDDEASRRLKEFDWPGNVRQLENVIQHAALMCEGGIVTASDLSVGPVTAPDGKATLTILESVERDKIREVLEKTSGNKAAAAAMLGVTRQTLYNKLRYYGMIP